MSDSSSSSSSSRYLHLPDECWESVFKFMQDPSHLETLSLVSTQFLSITNRIRTALSITPQSVPLLQNLLLRFPNLTSLSFTRFHGDLNALLSQVALSDIPNLISLDLSAQFSFPSKGLRSFSKKFPSLKSLNCSYMCSLTNSDLVLIANSFPNLEELDISYLFDPFRSNAILFDYNNSNIYNDLNAPVSGFGVMAMASGLKKLRKLNVSGNLFLNDKVILSICEDCEFLEELVVGDLSLVSQSGVAAAIRKRSLLRSLRVMQIGVGVRGVSLEFIDALLSLKGLSYVDFSNSRISDELLCAVAEAELPLRKLVLQGCSNFSYGGISRLVRKCGRLLQHLDLHRSEFLSDECVLEMSFYLGGLISVNLGGNLGVTDSSFFAIVRNCRFITEIMMEGTGVGKKVEEEDSLMMGLVENLHVKSLFLGQNSWLKDESVRRFASVCPNLERLDLHSSRGVSDDVVEVLKRCCKIRHLNLHCSGLKMFPVSFEVPSLRVLDLKWLRICDETLIAISKSCHRLLHLELEGCEDITSKGVKQVVEKCKQLRIINLRCCDKVASDVVMWMVFARPSLRSILSPPQFRLTESQREFFVRHGCLVSEDPW